MASARTAVVDITPGGTVPLAEPGLAWWPVLAVAVMLFMINVAAHKTGNRLYMFWVLGGSVVVLSFGRLDGCTWRDLGLAPGTWIPGAVWGIAAVALVFALYEIGSALPRFRAALSDSRIAGMPRWKVYFKTLIELPLGTVLFEEIAFRGVLWAMLARRTETVTATLATALLFGMWHILGSLDLHERNPGLAVHDRPRVAQAIAVSGAVLNTAFAGLLFTGLRIMSGSLIAPMGLHWAANGWGYIYTRRFSQADRN